MVKRVAGIAFLLAFFVLLYPLVQIRFFQPQELQPKPAGDCLMILGAKVLDDNSPDLMMQERIATAVEHINREVATVIVSGGTVDNKKSEAMVMKEALRKAGVPGEKIVLEEKSTSTYENFLFSKPLIQQLGCERLDVVSHRFHLSRATMVASRLGIAINHLIPAHQASSDPPERIFREYKAFFYYWLFL